MAAINQTPLPHLPFVSLLTKTNKRRTFSKNCWIIHSRLLPAKGKTSAFLSNENRNVPIAIEQQLVSAIFFISARHMWDQSAASHMSSNFVCVQQLDPSSITKAVRIMIAINPIWGKHFSNRFSTHTAFGSSRFPSLMTFITHTQTDCSQTLHIIPQSRPRVTF